MKPIVMKISNYYKVPVIILNMKPLLMITITKPLW